MLSFGQTLLHTVAIRPYVFIFLAVFLFLGFRTRGGLLTWVFLFTGYFIAWISEASSIRTGFPYGWYSYVYENLKGEWMNWGVPVWDSLSYTFLCFAGMALAEFIFLNARVEKMNDELSYKSKRKMAIFDLVPSQLVQMTLLGAAFVVILDIIVDPLAHQGDKWFLGHIYYYPNPGYYFDVPISNFLGWFLVANLIIGANLAIERFLSRPPTPYLGLLQASHSKSKSFVDQYGGLLLYFGIFLFNWGITLWIRDWILALVDLAWIAIPIGLCVFASKSSEKI